MLDHGSHIFVWHGSALASFRDCDAVRASCLDFAIRLSSGRFPLPDVRVVTQACPRPRLGKLCGSSLLQ